MVAGALDHRDGAGIADREALAGDPAEIAFAFDRAVEHGVADDDRLLRNELHRLARRIDDQAAAGEALADIVVGLAFQLQRHAAREPRAEALSGRAPEADMDGVVGQPGMAVPLGDFAREHGARGAVGVQDRKLEAGLAAEVERGLALGDQRAVDNVEDLVVLRARTGRCSRRPARRACGTGARSRGRAPSSARRRRACPASASGRSSR